MTREGCRNQLPDIITIAIRHRKKHCETVYPPVTDIVSATMEVLPSDTITVDQLVDAALTTIRKIECAQEVPA